jgi:type II secretory pathway component PulL
VDSKLCLAVPLSFEENAKLSQAAMTFLLEDEIPLALEDLTVDFVRRPRSALGIAVINSAVEPVIRLLHDLHVEVPAILPTAWAFAQAVLEDAANSPFDGLIWQSNQTWEVIVLEDGLTCRWYSVTGDQEILLPRLALAWRDSKALPRVLLVHDEDCEAERLRSVAVIETATGRTPQSQIANLASRIAAGNLRPWINLRRGKFAPPEPYRRLIRPVAALFATLVVALVVATLVNWRWAAHYDQLAQELLVRQQEVFRKVFPKEPVPVGVVERLQSEERRRGIGTQKDEREEATKVSAFQSLHQVFKLLPSNVRFRILDISADEQRISISGETRHQTDVDHLAKSLSAHPSFPLAMPRTRKGSNNQTLFTFVADYEAESPAEGSKP